MTSTEYRLGVLIGALLDKGDALCLAESDQQDAERDLFGLALYQAIALKDAAKGTLPASHASAIELNVKDVEKVKGAEDEADGHSDLLAEVERLKGEVEEAGVLRAAVIDALGRGFSRCAYIDDDSGRLAVALGEEINAMLIAKDAKRGERPALNATGEASDGAKQLKDVDQ